MNMNNQIEFNKENCIGCRLCYKSCFIDVIRWNEESKIPDFRHLDNCVCCNYCEVVCPKDCLKVLPIFEVELFHHNFNRYI